MEIKTLELTNFRQFYGHQKMNFAVNSKKNVTIIMGQNGAGKTGIFRAVLFALFGDIELSQDLENVDVHLINENALHEANGKPVSAQVKLTFEHSGFTYVISRYVRGRWDGHNYFQEPVKDQICELTILSDRSDSQIFTDRIVVNQKIEAIIRRDIREFFFFDAESLQILSDLGKADVRNSVRNGIYQLLQVQDLETGREILKSMYSRMQREIRSKAKDSKTQKNQNELNEVNTKIELYRKQAAELEINISQAIQELKEKKERYQSSTSTRELSDKIQYLKNEANQLNQTLEQRLANMAELVNKGAIQLFGVILPDIQQKVVALRSTSQDNIPKYILEKSLQDGICALCGHSLADDPDANDHVMKLLRLFKYSETATYLSNVEQGIIEVEQSKDNFIKKQSKAIAGYVSDQKLYREKYSDLDALSNQLKINSNEIAELKGLAEAIDHITKDIASNKTKLLNCNESIAKFSQERDNLNKILLQSKSAEDDLKYRAKESTLLKSMEESLSEILDEYSTNSRKQLEKATVELFKKFIAEKDRDLIFSVIIEENYQIKILNNQHRNLSNDLSQGEKQVLSLAFIMALAKIASNGRNEMAFPLFMDTPFARIDGDNRDKLINEIPTVTDQWVLLLTDTEFTAAERDQFLLQNSVGAVYKLNSVDGKTTIDDVEDLALLELRGETNG